MKRYDNDALRFITVNNVSTGTVSLSAIAPDIAAPDGKAAGVMMNVDAMGVAGAIFEAMGIVGIATADIEMPVFGVPGVTVRDIETGVIAATNTDVASKSQRMSRQQGLAALRGLTEVTASTNKVRAAPAEMGVDSGRRWSRFKMVPCLICVTHSFLSHSTSVQTS